MTGTWMTKGRRSSRVAFSGNTNLDLDMFLDMRHPRARFLQGADADQVVSLVRVGGFTRDVSNAA